MQTRKTAETMKTNQSVLITFVILVSVAGCLSAPIHKFNGRAGALKYDTIVVSGESTSNI